MTTDTPKQFEAINWWNSLSPSEAIELRNKYAPDIRLLDMPNETIVLIWEGAKADKHYSIPS